MEILEDFRAGSYRIMKALKMDGVRWEAYLISGNGSQSLLSRKNELYEIWKFLISLKKEETERL